MSEPETMDEGEEMGDEGETEGLGDSTLMSAMETSARSLRNRLLGRGL